MKQQKNKGVTMFQIKPMPDPNSATFNACIIVDSFLNITGRINDYGNIEVMDMVIEQLYKLVERYDDNDQATKQFVYDLIKYIEAMKLEEQKAYLQQDELPW